MIAYSYKNNIYLNITNRCTMRCDYCIKNKWKWAYRGYNLRLKKEPTIKEIIRETERLINSKKTIFSPKTNEIVFCGYGEPLIRLETVKTVAAYFKTKGIIIRINTNGHANLIHKRNICPELRRLVDKIYISLNGENKKKYLKLNKPKYGLKTFDGVLNFAKECKKNIKDVFITTIAHKEINTQKCRKIAKKLGVKFILRPFLEKYENQ